jgi:integrase
MNTTFPFSRAQRFEAVLDSRKRKVSGLWRRGHSYYAQMRVDLGNGQTAPRRIRLDATTLEGARIALRKKQTQKDEGKLSAPGFRPKFEECADGYLESQTFLRKKLGTQRSERQAIARWRAHIGGVRIDKISPPMIHSYRQQRLTVQSHKSPKRCISERTVNLDVVALRQVLRHANESGHVENIVQFFAPERGGSIKALKRKREPERRPLLTKEQFQELLAAATEETTKNSTLFRYYLRFLALTGAREKEALAIRKTEDVDFVRRTVRVGAEGVSKNSKVREVDFSPELEALLKEMNAALPSDTSWLFPSPQRGQKDIHAQTLRESLIAVRKKAGLQWVGFHDLRHFFASECVMAGIDSMTIATWLGHSDGGILVGKVYGHLADTHKQAAARKLRFFT